eukprot:1056627-Prymnesium_polylepis.1
MQSENSEPGPPSSQLPSATYAQASAGPSRQRSCDRPGWPAYCVSRSGHDVRPCLFRDRLNRVVSLWLGFRKAAFATVQIFRVAQAFARALGAGASKHKPLRPRPQPHSSRDLFLVLSRGQVQRLGFGESGESEVAGARGVARARATPRATFPRRAMGV